MNKGFTLIEIIIFIVVFSIGVMGIMMLFFNTLGKTSDPTLRLRGVQVAEAVMEEIKGKKWDESTPNGGDNISTTIANICTEEPIDQEEEFDDIDDYVKDSNCDANTKTYSDYTSSDFGFDNLTSGFDISIKVGFADNSTGVYDFVNSQTNFKLIEIKVTKGVLNETYTLRMLKGNF
ncbi:prepilin-type N-terminal cleavage/methylation domain-containing protein [Flexistipes sp.]|uniref:prepilin-type N-terminal cleavage/methylation domain-containing protein n=1 Tax=Flexistipes sp. TaxID=3088135 RepID=UPI002E23229C|nr:prepilin-type N-terminal cleavage/methylation domain-containing protein [Flexistipes sp.]